MKSCKNKFILLLASLLTCATVFTFVGCSGVGGVVVSRPEDDKDDIPPDAVDHLGYASGIPQQFILNGITYEIDYTQHGDYELGEIIGYRVNRENYQYYYKENPDVLYSIDEKNTIFTSDNYNRFTIYSLKGHDVEQFVALYAVDRVVNVYLNHSYMGGT